MSSLNISKDINWTKQEVFCGINLEFYQIILLVSLNIPSAMIALIGNCLILLALLKMTSLHPPSKIFLASLALTDLCVGAVSQPLYIMNLLLRGKLCLRYLQIITFISITLFGGASLLTVTAISVDRLLALKMMLRYKQVVTLRRAGLTIVLFWLMSVVVSIMLVVYFFVMPHIVCTVLLLCMVTSTFCYTRIYKTLRRHQNQIQVVHVQEMSEGSNPLIVMSRYRKTVSSAVWVQLAFLVCYVPYLLAVIFYLTGTTSLPSYEFFVELATSLVLLNSSLNPFIYCWKIDGVRKAAKDVIKSRC